MGRPLTSAARPSERSANRELLWEALLDGTIDDIASDHLTFHVWSSRT